MKETMEEEILKEYRLYNRYRVPVVLRQLAEDSDEYLLDVPEKELQWVQVSYDWDFVKDENGIEQKVEKDYSVDPSGGPYIILGDNRLSLYPSGQISVNVESIRLEKGRGYILKVNSIENL